MVETPRTRQTHFDCSVRSQEIFWGRTHEGFCCGWHLHPRACVFGVLLPPERREKTLAHTAIRGTDGGLSMTAVREHATIPRTPSSGRQVIGTVRQHPPRHLSVRITPRRWRLPKLVDIASSVRSSVPFEERLSFFLKRRGRQQQEQRPWCSEEQNRPLVVANIPDVLLSPLPSKHYSSTRTHISGLSMCWMNPTFPGRRKIS